MWINDILQEGWWQIMIAYAVVYYLAVWAVYKIIFRAFVGQPSSFSYADIRLWRRKISVMGAVIFAPAFEEFMFTNLAYSSFLNIAQPNKEGIVILLVATFFAVLHFPGDWYRIKNSPRPVDPFYLLVLQFSRFFFSLAAYFLYTKTGSLFFPIVLHYFANGLTSLYNFDLQDGVKGTGNLDFIALLIILGEVGFCLYANFNFYYLFPQLSLYLLIAGSVFILGFLRYSSSWLKN